RPARTPVIQSDAAARAGRRVAGRHRRSPGERRERPRQLAHVQPDVQRLALQPARPDQHRQHQEARAEVDLCGRRPRRAADDPRREQRRDVHDVDRPGRQPGARAERRHRRAPVETRPEDPGGRRRPRPCHSPQPRRGPPQGQGDLRHARRPSRRPRRQDGQAGMGDEDRGLRRWVFVSQAPLVIKSKVIVGIAGPGEMGPRGFVEAFDAETGKSLWRWYSVPAAGEPGSETWQADTWKIGGGAVWHTGTYDPATNLLDVGTGNPAPWIADMRRGENLYTMSAVALDVDSGKMKWYHQYLANEPWDFDTMAEHHVIDVVRGGQTHKAVVQANKLGYVYTLDRITGKFLSAVPFAKSVTWGGPDPVTGKGVENPGLRPTMGGPPVEVCPSLLGATGW